MNNKRENPTTFVASLALLNKTTTPQFPIAVFIVNMAYRYVEEKIGGVFFEWSITSL